jgi:ribonuclease HI
VRTIVEETVDLSRPWAYFDGASQNDGRIYGGEVSLYIFETHFFNIKMGLGHGTNNFAELMAVIGLIGRCGH